MAGSAQLNPAARATIIDVAAAAGVSRQTVTRAMNDMSGISAATKARVLDAAARLSYRPSRFGRGLVKPQQRTLGLLLTDLTNPYYPELASAVIGAAAALGWSVLIAEDRHARDRRTQLSELAAQVDALVGYVYDDGVPLTGPDGRPLGPPVVRIDATPGRDSEGAVGLNLRLAVEQVIDHLAARGVRHPVMVDANRADEPSERALLFGAGWAARGVEVPVVPALRYPGDTVETGRDGVVRALAEHPGLDAVFCFNDLMALGVLGELRSRGIAVPEQVRVVGVDGLSLGTLVSPTLTTLAVDLTEVARQAVDLAVGMERGDVPRSGPAARRNVGYRLVVRESA